MKTCWVNVAICCLFCEKGFPIKRLRFSLPLAHGRYSMLKIKESNENLFVKNDCVSVSQPAIPPVRDFPTPKLCR